MARDGERRGRKIAHLSTVHRALDPRLFFKEAITAARAGYLDKLNVTGDLVHTSLVVEGSYTWIQTWRTAMAQLAGKLVIDSSSVYTFTGLDGVTPRLVGTQSSSGRTISSIDGD